MAREKVSVNFNLYPDIPQEKEMLDFLEDKPNTFILKEALKLYMVSYNSMISGGMAQPTQEIAPKAKKFFNKDK